MPYQTTFVGRKAQLAAVQKELTTPQARLLSLTGAGGIGKTRLALQVMAGLADEFEHGVFFIELAPIQPPELVLSTIARAVGLQEAGEESVLKNLEEYVRDKRILLVLDNVGSSFAFMLAELLDAAPQLWALATTTGLLQAQGECEHPLPPLAVPDLGQPISLEQLLQCEAVPLFSERARAAQADFALTHDNAKAVAEICARLAGLPLAIELAAARVQTLPPTELEASLSDSLLAVGSAQDSSTHQQLVRGAIEWSYKLLPASAQDFFRRLAVFDGSLTPKAAEVVCSPADDMDVLNNLELLANLGLLNRFDVIGASVPRYEMVETIRCYGLEQLAASGEGETARRQHARFFLAMAQGADLYGPTQIAWLDRLDAEHHNLRAVLGWALECQGADVEIGVNMAVALKEFWLLRGHVSEGRRWLGKALAKAPDSPPMQAAILEAAAEARENPTRAETLLKQSLALYQQLGDKSGVARVLCALGEAVSVSSDYERATALYKQGLALCQELGDKRGISRTLALMGNVARLEHNYEHAAVLYEQCLTLAREIEDRHGIIDALWGLGFIARERRDYRKAARCYAETLALSRELEDNRRVARLLNSMGEMARLQGNYEQAAAFYNDSLSLSRRVGYGALVPTVLHNLGYIAAHQANWQSASSFFRESLHKSRELGDPTITAFCLAGLAGVASAERQPARAARLFGLAEALLHSMGDSLNVADQAEWDSNMAAVRTQLDEAAFSAAWQEGKAMSIDRWMEA